MSQILPQSPILVSNRTTQNEQQIHLDILSNQSHNYQEYPLTYKSDSPSKSYTLTHHIIQYNIQTTELEIRFSLKVMES
jgi:hypothetical protein